MDERPNSQKRPLCELDDNGFYCPDCKDLEEHRNKNCSKQLLSQATSSSNTMYVNSDEEDGHEEKRHCYRCDNCQLSFASNQHLQDHMKENCLEVSFVSFQSCMETLKSALQLRDDSLNSFRTARFQVSKALGDYSGARQRKNYSFEAFSETMDKRQNTWTPHQNDILTHVIQLCSQQFNNDYHELELAKNEVNRVAEEVKNLGQTTLSAEAKVVSACFEAIKALKEERFDIALSFKSQAQELKNIKHILNNNSAIVTELKGGMTALEESVSETLKCSSSESESDGDATTSAAESESDRDAATSSAESESDMDADI